MGRFTQDDFNDIGEQDFNQGGSYFAYHDDKSTARYRVRVDAVRAIETRKVGDAIVIECTVLTSTHPRFKPGDPIAQMIQKRHAPWKKNYGWFLVAANGLDDIKQIDKAGALAALSSENPLGGIIMACEVEHTITRENKKDFAVVRWQTMKEFDAKLADIEKIAAQYAPAKQALGEG